MGNQITPLASLCLGVVRGWIRVAMKGKGGQIDSEGTAWSRLPADQLRDQLSREFMVETSTRSIHRALKELTDSNLLRREQRWKQRYKRDYWYAIPEHEEELLSYSPKTVHNKFRSERSRSNGHHEVTDGSVHVLNTPNINKNHFSQEGTAQNQQPKRIKTNSRVAMSIGDAIQKCNSNGNRPKPRGFSPESTPAEPRKPIPIGFDTQGRPLTEVWGQGTKHLVVD